jgi:YesN/AraC family two-component response regulator
VNTEPVNAYEIILGNTDSAAALKAFLSRPRAYGLLITDMTMPGMAGTDLAKAVTLTRPAAQPP